MNVLLTVSTFIFPFITFPYISRILLPTGTGKVSFATSVISYFNLFAQMGIPTYGIRVCAQVRDDKKELTRTAHELLIINLILNVVTYAAFFVALAIIPQMREEKLLFLIISSTVFLSSLGMEWLYRALEEYKYITVRSIVFKFVALIMMFLLVHEERDYVLYGAISIFASSASNILNLINAHKYIGFKPMGGYNLRRHMKPIAIFFSMACASTIYTHLDTVMLGFMRDSTEVGLYNAAVKIKTILVSVVTSLGTVLLPRASYFVQTGEKDKFWRVSRKAMHFVIIVAFPMLIYCMLFAENAILFLSGDAFVQAVPAMIIIMPTLLMIGMTNVMGIQILVPLGREKAVLVSEICGAVVDLAINAALIPLYGAAGAAIGTVIAECVVAIVQITYLRKHLEQLFGGIRYMAIVLAALVGIFGSFWVRSLALGHFMALLISAILFFGAYGVTLLCLKEEMATEIIDSVRSRVQKVIQKHE